LRFCLERRCWPGREHFGIADLHKRLHDERAFPHSGVRDDQVRLVDHALAVKEQVEIECAGAVGDAALAAVSLLDCQQPIEKLARPEVGLEPGDGVEISRLAGGTADRLGLVHCRAAQDVDIPALFEVAESGLDVGLAVAEV
jgi:hypothetical protein